MTDIIHQTGSAQMTKSRWTSGYEESGAIAMLEKAKFKISEQFIYGKKGIGSNGCGACIDYLVKRKKYIYIQDRIRK